MDATVIKIEKVNHKHIDKHTIVKVVVDILIILQIPYSVEIISQWKNE